MRESYLAFKRRHNWPENKPLSPELVDEWMAEVNQGLCKDKSFSLSEWKTLWDEWYFQVYRDCGESRHQMNLEFFDWVRSNK